MFKRILSILTTLIILLCSCAAQENTGENKNNEQNINDENVQVPSDDGLEEVTDPGIYSIFG